MPLRRSDAELVIGEPPLRRIIPYVMPRRSDSLVFHATSYRVGGALQALQAQPKQAGGHPSLFSYFLWAMAQVLHAHPRLNRFVSGGRLYQRRGVFLSFVARTAWEDDAPTVTVKLAFPRAEPFPACARRIAKAVARAHAGRGAAEGRLALASRLPGFLLRLAVAGLRLGDRLNLLPGRLIAGDPLFTSAFVANLGSLGLGSAFHHLYEYGSASVFAVFGRVVEDVVQVSWTFDERACEGHDGAAALALLRQLLEQPEAHVRSAADPAVRTAAGT